MGIQFAPTLHPSEYGTEADEIMMDLNQRSARIFLAEVLEIPFGDGYGTIIPKDVLWEEDELRVRAAMLDAVDTDHIIEDYWSFRLGEFLDVARWADRKGRDILWS